MIGDLDALPGCGISFLLKPQFRVEHYKEQNKWDQVTLHYALQLPQDSSGATKELMNSFKKNSLFQIPLLCSESNITEPQYECLWRLGQWNIEQKRTEYFTDEVKSDDFEKFRFFSLKALYENNLYSFDENRKLQSCSVVEKLLDTSLESCENIYSILTQLRCIVEMEDFSGFCVNQAPTSYISKWTLNDSLLSKTKFCYVESIITQRLTMLSGYLLKREDAECKRYFVDLVLNFAGKL